MKTQITYFVLAILSLSLLSSVSAKNDSNDNHVIQEFEKGYIDWTDKIIRVKGSGAIANDKPIGQARLLAERAAVADAYRQITEIVYGVRVNSETTVKDFVVESDIIKTRVEGFIKGARKGEKKINSDGTVEYELYVPIYGQNALSDVIDLDLEIKKSQKMTMKKSHNSLLKYNNKFVFNFNESNDYFKIANSPEAKSNNTCLECHTPHPIKEKMKKSVNIEQYNKQTQSVYGVFRKEKTDSSNPKETNEATVYPTHKATNEITVYPKIEPSSSPNNTTLTEVITSPNPKVIAEVITSTINNNESESKSNITGVIIDAKGLGLVPAMDPAILNSEMKRVYIGNWEIDPDFVISNGIIGYFTEVEDAKKDVSRVGNNPMVIKAKSVKNLTNLVLELIEADKLLNIDKSNNFLEKYAVNVVM